MGFKPKKLEAATSLMEIMMIFAIIGVVTAAGMSLSKPKSEYMTKIALYSAYTQLSSAALTIVQEGHIDYSTDLDTCITRNTTTYACEDAVSSTGSLIKYSLPKAVSRDASNSSTEDKYKRAYTSLSTQAAKNKYIYLQQGLCQRMANLFSLDGHNIACPTKVSDVAIANLNSANFRESQPHLFLPNGQVYYFGRNLNYQMKDSSGNNKTISINTDATSSNRPRSAEAKLSNNGALIYADIRDFNLDANPLKDNSPNETRLAFVKAGLNNLPPSSSYTTSHPLVPTETEYKNYLNYLKILWAEENNTDYFNVAIDINGKMQNSNDYSNGPDILNQDIFIFKIYRNGLVMPDYDSGFPRNYLTAKVMIKQEDTQYNTGDLHKKIFRPYQLSSNVGKYANLPLDIAYCYAGIAGDPTYLEINKAKNYDTISTAASTKCLIQLNPSSSTKTRVKFLGQYSGGNCTSEQTCCVASDGSTEKCKVLVNQPSFFVK